MPSFIYNLRIITGFLLLYTPSLSVHAISWSGLRWIQRTLGVKWEPILYETPVHYRASCTHSFKPKGNFAKLQCLKVWRMECLLSIQYSWIVPLLVPYDVKMCKCCLLILTRLHTWWSDWWSLLSVHHLLEMKFTFSCYNGQLVAQMIVDQVTDAVK